MNGWTTPSPAFTTKAFPLYNGLGPGIYTFMIHCTTTAYNATVAGSDHNRYLLVGTKYGIICGNRFTNDTTGYSEATLSGIFKFDEEQDLTINMSVNLVNGTITKGIIYYRFLKLCDI